MTVLGRGAVAIWHDIAAEGREQFYAWHGTEHMPERVAIPGFLRGRRYVAIEADREFFNLYETRDASVVRGEEYKARLENPTPWTVETVRYFSNVARSLCAVEWTRGEADGGLVATLRYSVPAEEGSRHVTRIRPLLDALEQSPGVASVHLIAADLDASGFVNAEQRARGTANEIPTHALIVEGWADEEAFVRTMREKMSEFLPDAGTPGIYRHQITTMKPAAAA